MDNTRSSNHGGILGKQTGATGTAVQSSNMITAQRVYQANAQTIKTHDQLLQTIVNLR